MELARKPGFPNLEIVRFLLNLDAFVHVSDYVYTLLALRLPSLPALRNVVVVLRTPLFDAATYAGVERLVVAAVCNVHHCEPIRRHAVKPALWQRW